MVGNSQLEPTGSRKPVLIESPGLVDQLSGAHDAVRSIQAGLPIVWILCFELAQASDR